MQPCHTAFSASTHVINICTIIHKNTFDMILPCELKALSDTDPKYVSSMHLSHLAQSLTLFCSITPKHL